MWRSTLDVYVFMVWIGIMHVKQASRIQIHQVNSCEDLQNPHPPYPLPPPRQSTSLGHPSKFLIPHTSANGCQQCGGFIDAFYCPDYANLWSIMGHSDCSWSMKLVLPTPLVISGENEVLTFIRRNSPPLSHPRRIK